MMLLAPLLATLGLLAGYASATALTYKLVPNEKECFYTHVSNAGAKIAFYFAVSSGGNFDSMAPGDVELVPYVVRNTDTYHSRLLSIWPRKGARQGEHHNGGREGAARRLRLHGK